jgi:hypothetical protein
MPPTNTAPAPVSMTGTTPSQHEARAHALAEKFIGFLETNEVPDGLFAADMFCDFTLPTWRLQASGRADSVAMRLAGHPVQGTVPRWRFDPTPTGFVLEVEEAWDADGEHWTCREMFRADTGDEGITQISVYCTGDWDAARRAEHAAAVTLIRP